MALSSDVSIVPNLNTAWENSYQRRENFVFYPEEEVVRFLSRYIRKRIGLDKFKNVAEGLSANPKILDLGCGIGRHISLSLDFGFDPFGIDLSSNAVKAAIDWTLARGWDGRNQIVQGSVADLPWEKESFDHVISHAVLDSMPFEIAKAGCAEVARVLKSGGFFYFDVIAGHESGKGIEFNGELTITDAHETGTVQSYFDSGKIDEMLGASFKVLQRTQIVRTDFVSGRATGRWHIVCQK